MSHKGTHLEPVLRCLHSLHPSREAPSQLLSKEDVNWGAEGIWRAEAAPKALKPLLSRQRGARASADSLACPGALGLGKWNQLQAVPPVQLPAALSSLRSGFWLGVDVPGGICSRSQPALFGRAVVVWHLLE